MGKPQKNRTIIFVGLIAMLMGIVVMAGWLLHVPVVTNNITTRFNASLAFTFFGAALLTSQYQVNKYHNAGYITLCVLGAIIGFVTFSQDIFHYNAGIDQFFVFDKSGPSTQIPFPGREKMIAGPPLFFDLSIITSTTYLDSSISR